jgi:glycosyltransferase involved in cell wall biosynthesis
MKLSVLVPTYRRPHELRHCLNALAMQTRPPDEVLVVVRDSDDETWAFLRGCGLPALPLRSISTSRPGLIAAMDAGLAQAQGDIVAITDDDAVPRPDWLARIEAHFLANPRVAGVGGRDWLHANGRVEDGTRQVVGQVRWFGRVIGNHHLGSGGPREVDVLKGVNCAYRRALIRRVGLDQHLRGAGAQVYWELGLGIRLRRAGWTLVYDPAVAVDHYPAARFDEDQRGRQSLRAFWNEAYNQMYVMLDCLPPGRKALALTYGLAVGSRHAPGAAIMVLSALSGAAGGSALQRYRAATTARLAACVDVLRLKLSAPVVRRRGPVAHTPGNER